MVAKMFVTWFVSKFIHWLKRRVSSQKVCPITQNIPNTREGSYFGNLLKVAAWVYVEKNQHNKPNTNSKFQVSTASSPHPNKCQSQDMHSLMSLPPSGTSLTSWDIASTTYTTSIKRHTPSSFNKRVRRAEGRNYFYWSQAFVSTALPSRVINLIIPLHSP